MTLDEARQYVLARAAGRGIMVEILGQRDREFTVKAFQGQIEQMTEAVRGGVGVRVVVDGRVGYAYAEELTPPALDWMLDEAVENAALQQEATGFLPDGQALGQQDLLGESLTASPEAKAQAALGFETTLREDPRVRQVTHAAYTERIREVSMGSSRGTAGGYRRGVAGMIGSIVMQEGESRKQAWNAEWTTSLQTLDPGRTALDLTERTGRLLGARPLRTGRYAAYFEPKAFAALMGTFWQLWSGKAVLEGKSRLAGRLGDLVASPVVTLIDDPLLPGGLGTRPFDAEGTPARTTVLVDEGRLRTYLTNSDTARALRLENTGHAARHYRGILAVGPSNFYLKPGAGVTPRHGVLVTEVTGVHAGANAISGEFSVQALGLWMENGKVAYPVENFAVAGDFLKLLEQITGLGEALAWDLGMPGAFGTPLVEVADLSFAGA